MNRTIAACLLAVSFGCCAASCDDEAPSQGSPAEDVTSESMDVTFPDLPQSDGVHDAVEEGVFLDRSADRAGEPVEDREEDSVTDLQEEIWVEFEPFTTRCANTTVYGGPLEVTLRWSTEEPAVCDLTVSVDGGPAQLLTVGDGSPHTHHGFQHDVTSFHWTDAPPALGDPVVWAVTCTSVETGGSGSAATSLSISLGHRECIWPYDETCSDGTLVECALALPFCDPGLVPIAVDRCVRCGYPATCTCDDGTVATCPDAPPDCPIDQVVAVRDQCYQCVNRYTCHFGEEECGRYVSAKADCSYQWYQSAEENACPTTICQDAPCQTDGDCPIPGMGEAGDKCVLGSCAFCWEDSHCDDSLLCRGGRCVDTRVDCLRTARCSDEGCGLVTPSEGPCPVCVCDDPFDIACTADSECQLISHHPFSHCVFGRCVDCRNDDDCAYGSCMPPGICSDSWSHAESIYGTWLIGWGGGIDHFSYFRFEPDGTFRRGFYEPAGAWSDDIPPLPCDVGTWPLDYPVVGTWEPQLSDSGRFFVRVSLNLSCHDGAGWSAMFAVDFSDDGSSATLFLDGTDTQYQGEKVPAHSCNGDMTWCRTPG